MLPRCRALMLSLALILAVLGCTAMASTETTIVTVDAALIEQVLTSMEIEYEAWLDAYGDPMWAFTYRGILTTVVLYDRVSNARYESLLFYAGWSTDGAMSLEMVNAWNRASRFGRAYVDEAGDPVIELDLLVAGGITTSTIQAYLEVFVEAAATLGNAVGL